MILIRKRFLGLLFLFLPVTLLAQQEEPVSLTAPEAACRSALIRILTEQGIPFEERSLFAGSGGFGSSVYVEIPRSIEMESDGAAGTLVLGIPLSGAEERESRPLEDRLPFGVETGLAFIKHIRARSPGVYIRVAFLGDEASRLPEDQRKDSHRGLEDLYASLDEPENSVLLYLDMAEAPQSLLIHHGASKNIAPLNVLEPLHTLCESHSIPHTLAVQFNELYKLGLVQGHPVMRFAYTRLLNTLYVSGSNPGLPAKTESDPRNVGAGIAAEDLAALLADYADSLKISSENLDYHFLILPILEHYLFISESMTVAVFIMVIGVFLLAILIHLTIHRKRLIILWQVFIFYTWILPVLLVFLVGALEAAGLLIAVVARKFESSPLINDFGWVCFKVVIALLLFSPLFSVWNLFKIPKKADFYGAAAVLLVLLGTFIAVFLDITFTPIFIWVCLCTLLGTCANKPILVYICAFSTPLLAFRPLMNVLRVYNGGLLTPFLSGGRLTEIFLSHNIVHSLYVAVIMLPFLLLFERGIALAQEKKRLLPLRRRIVFIMILFIISLGALALYTYRLSKNVPVAPVRRMVAEKAAGTDILNITLNHAAFLERRSITITIEARGNPLCFNLYLDMADKTPPVIYASPMPFTITNDWKSIAFRLGEGPPNPFTTEIVLPLDFAGSLRVEALYTAWDPAVDILPPPESDDYVLQVIKTVPLLE